MYVRSLAGIGVRVGYEEPRISSTRCVLRLHGIGLLPVKLSHIPIFLCMYGSSERSSVMVVQSSRVLFRIIAERPVISWIGNWDRFCARIIAGDHYDSK